MSAISIASISSFMTLALIFLLNRVILLDCDYFIVPVACDLFSVRALKTLGRNLFSWITQWRTIVELAPPELYVLPGLPKFLGYIPQSFSVYRGGIVRNQAKYLSLLERSIQSELLALLSKFDIAIPGASSKLGEVKDFGTLVAASQTEGVPIYEVKSAGTPDQKSAARGSSLISDRIIRLTR